MNPVEWEMTQRVLASNADRERDAIAQTVQEALEAKRQQLDLQVQVMHDVH